ncbi:MAG: sialidase family protein, partial [Nitrososphaerota archaeon]
MRLVGYKVLVLAFTALFMLPTIFGEEGELRAQGLRVIEAVEGRLSGGVASRFQFTGGESSRELTAQQPSSTTPSGPLVNIPYRSPTAKFSRNVIVTYDLGSIPYQNEPHIAYNPLNPDHLVVVSHDYDTACAVNYVSFDGGETWRGPYTPSLLPGDSFCSDPVVTFGRDGKVYYSYLSIGSKPLRVGRLLYTADVSSATLSVSLDGGATWTAYLAATGGVTPSEDRAAITFIDKPWMAVGPDPVDRSRDNIYITYTEFRLTYPYLDFYPFVGEPVVEVSIKLVRSSDGGRTWSRPIAVSPIFSALAGDEDARLVQGSNIAVASDGTLYVAYYDSLDDGPFKGLFTPFVAVSRDGGQSFSRAAPVVPGGLWEQGFFLKPTYFRSWSSMFPYIAVSPLDSKVLYIVFGALGEAAADNSDVFFVKSADGGETWSRAKRVNDDLTSRNQFFPTLTVSPNGHIHVMWGDMRDDPNNYRYHIYYTRSEDGGETFMENSRVSDYPSNPSYGIRTFVGDYWGITATDEDVYMVWTDSRAGFRGAPNQDIAFARLRRVKSPTIFLSPPEGPAGQTLSIVGEGFAARQREVFIEFDGVVISSFLTD